MLTLKQWLVWQLRKASYRWPSRYQAMKAAKTGPNEFKCAKCGGKYARKGGTGTRKSISLDHITPVVDPTKPNAFEEALAVCACGVCDYIRRMFCGPEGLQVLCKSCHDIKTKGEMTQRKESRRAKKLLKEKKPRKKKEVQSNG